MKGIAKLTDIMINNQMGINIELMKMEKEVKFIDSMIIPLNVIFTT